MPALVMIGDRDAVVSVAEARTLAAQIAGSRLLVYESTGHTPQWEHPERFVRDVLSFTTSQPGGR